MRRSLRLFQNAHPVQRIVDELDRSLKKSRKVLGKRHTIYHQNFMEISNEIKDYNITTQFAEFKRATTVLPTLERSIEKEYLKELADPMTDPEKRELIESWKERERVANMEKYYSTMIPSPSTVFEEDVKVEQPDFEIANPANPTEEDIGKFFSLTKEKAEVLFSNGLFGNYFRDHYSRCPRFEFMLREETLNLINMLKASQNINNNKYPDLSDSSPIKDLEPIQQLGWLIRNHPQSYLALHKKISWLMLDYVYSAESIPLYNIMRNSADLFTATAAILLQELAKSQLFKIVGKNIDFTDYKAGLSTILNSEELKEIVEKVLDFYVQVIPSPDDYLRIIPFSQFVEHISPMFFFTINENPIEISLKQYIDLENRFNYPEQLKKDMGRVQTLSASTILTGMRGSGKSQVLAGVAAWASAENNWVLVKVPRSTDFTKNATNLLWEPDAIYFQPEVAYDILKEIFENNKEKLKKIKINPKIYGKYSFSGMHPDYDKGYESVPNLNVFLREEQVWTDQWKKYYSDEILEEVYKGIRYYAMYPRLSRFEYEIKRYSSEMIPEMFNKVLDGENLIDNISMEQLFDLTQSKRKPKKRMLPKSKSDVLSFTLKPKIIDSQDLIEGDLEQAEELEPIPQMVEALPSPKNLFELAEFGLKQHLYATSALWEIMEHLYRSDDFNVLVLVDEFNELYRPSEYPSVKYINYKKTNGCIPPYDVSLGRLFMKLDGHMIKNGAKIVGISEKRTCYSTTYWKGDPLNQGTQFSMEMDRLALDDMRKLIKYYTFFEWNEFKYTENDIATLFMLSQGNFGLALENITYSPERTY